MSPNATLARLSPRLGTRALAASEQLDGGGPSPLTEDAKSRSSSCTERVTPCLPLLL